MNPFLRDLITFARIIYPFLRDFIPFARIINPFSRDLISFAGNLIFKIKHMFVLKIP